MSDKENLAAHLLITDLTQKIGLQNSLAGGAREFRNPNKKLISIRLRYLKNRLKFFAR